MNCLIDGCSEAVRTRGLCTRHYARLLRHGSPTGGAKDRAKAAGPGLRHCGRCGTVKPVEEFGSGGTNGYCRPCAADYSRERRRARGIEARRLLDRPSLDGHLRRKYGIDLAAYDAMFEAQGGVCALCGKPNAHGHRLAIDHCHATGKVRGLLCRGCNGGLGWVEARGLEAVARYLKH